MSVVVAQIRGARGLLGWSQTRLAEAASLSLPTVKRYESGTGVRVSSEAVSALRAALEAAGVIFVAENGEGPGVRLRRGVAAMPAAAASPERVKAGAEHARNKATKRIDRALSEVDATGQEKADRRDALTAVPEVVKRARGKSAKG